MPDRCPFATSCTHPARCSRPECIIAPAKALEEARANRLVWEASERRRIHLRDNERVRLSDEEKVSAEALKARCARFIQRVKDDHAAEVEAKIDEFVEGIMTALGV